MSEKARPEAPSTPMLSDHDMWVIGQARRLLYDGYGLKYYRTGPNEGCVTGFDGASRDAANVYNALADIHAKFTIPVKEMSHAKD